MSYPLSDEQVDKYFGSGIEEADGQEEETVPETEVPEAESENVEEETAEKPSEPSGEEPEGEPSEDVEDAETDAETPQNADEAQTAIDDGDVDPDDVSDIVGENGKYLTYRELAKGYSNLQSMKQKEINQQKKQIEEQQKTLEQWNQYYQQQQQAMQHQQQVASVTQEQIDYNIDMAPMDTFHWAMENDPNRIPYIISQAREKKGNAVADAMNFELQQAQMQYQMMHQQQMMEQQIQEKTGFNPIENNVNTAMTNITERYGDEFNKYSDQVSEQLEQGNVQIDWNDPASIELAVERTYLQVMRADVQAQAKRIAEQPREASPQAETGSPGQAPILDKFEDEVRNEVLEQYNATRR